MANNQPSKTVKASTRTYFFDVKETRKGKKKFLQITESRFIKETGDYKRSSLLVFPEDAADFQSAVEEMIGKIS